MTVGKREPVVTGVDGSEAALRAVRWAAGEAVRSERPLRLVHASAPPSHDYPNLEVTAAEIREAMWATGARRLEIAAAVARTSEPTLEIEAEARTGDPRVLLVEESWRAAVVVLGSRGLTGGGRLLLGSSGLALAVHGHCPVIVVRGGRTRSGPVLVGVDDWGGSAAAVRFAFQEASTLGVPVTVLKTWSGADPDGTVTAHEYFLRPLEKQIDRVAAEFPAVVSECLVVRGRPGRVLMEYGERAGLIVAGTRGHSGFGGLMLGSVGLEQPGFAPCPVAVVRPGVVPAFGIRREEPLSVKGDRT
ncbi:universal stress protein [Amycolatopsis oliviviridis]|uniref:Universal stress protein n=1 Tax=Amycolatopsis oliviviridis TaxID=1471590 RepID=A0ABQ3L5Z4_9PSEU|nr:universal stress protein [Amycolatopsis oliviviridis]GHH04777.1 universal stress protein [Amycolatopsis oliviviridis]